MIVHEDAASKLFTRPLRTFSISLHKKRLTAPVSARVFTIKNLSGASCHSYCTPETRLLMLPQTIFLFLQRTVSTAELEGSEDDRGKHEHRDDGRLVAQGEAVDDVGRGAGLARHRHLKHGRNEMRALTRHENLQKI